MPRQTTLLTADLVGDWVGFNEGRGRCPAKLIVLASEAPRQDTLQ